MLSSRAWSGLALSFLAFLYRLGVAANIRLGIYCIVFLLALYFRSWLSKREKGPLQSPSKLHNVGNINPIFIILSNCTGNRECRRAALGQFSGKMWAWSNADSSGVEIGKKYIACAWVTFAPYRPDSCVQRCNDFGIQENDPKNVGSQIYNRYSTIW